MAAHQGFLSSQRAIRFRATAFALVMAGAAALASVTPSRAEEDGDGAYLALGDSITFGFIASDGYAYVNPKNFVSYPVYVAGERLDVTNPACPGEASSGFISLTGADNGCRPFRAQFPLHVGYASSQLDFATNFLAAHRHTRLVTILLGANDIFLLETACKGAPACIQAGLPQTLATLGQNMNTILGRLRATGFHGVLVVVNYYSLDYTNPFQTGVVTALNQTLAAVAHANGAVVGDAFTAFQAAASTPFAGGQTCKAGLLNVNPGDPTQATCDVHPSQSGHQLLADAVEAAFKVARSGF
jgi:lysophospholipase L1-like esterase